MKIGFDNIYEHVIPMDDFRLKWRFTDEKYNMLPAEHLAQLKPLDKEASTFLWDHAANITLHNDIPFTEGFFAIVDKMKILPGNEDETKKWIYECGFTADKQVFLSWQTEDAMVVPWKLLIKYFNSFYYSSSDDLTVIDNSLLWALLFYHEDEIYFGTNTGYKPFKEFDYME